MNYDGGEVMGCDCKFAAGVEELVSVDGVMDQIVYRNILKKASRNLIY